MCPSCAQLHSEYVRVVEDREQASTRFVCPECALHAAGVVPDSAVEAVVGMLQCRDAAEDAGGESE
jgi:hypothetical protein